MLSGITGVTYLIRTVRETAVNNTLGSKSKMASPTCCVLTLTLTIQLPHIEMSSDTNDFPLMNYNSA